MSPRPLLFAMICLLSLTLGAKADPFKVVILVNTTPITQFEIDTRIDLLSDLGGSDDPETLRGQAIEALIDEALQLDFADQQGVLPSASAMEESFAAIATNNGLSTAEFAERLRSQGIDVTAFKSRILPQIAWNAVLGTVARASIVVSDEELKERWAEIQDAKGITERQLIEVYLMGGTRAQANAIAAKMRESGNFSDFARATSRSPLAAQGGNMGWVRDTELSKAARAAVRELSAGDVSSAVPGDDGFYIYGVNAIRPVGTAFVEQTYDVRELYVALEAQGQSASDAQKLQALQNVFRRVDSCERFDQASDIYGEGQSGAKGFVALNELPPRIAAVISATEVGTFSQLVPQPEGASIFAVCATSTRSEPLTKDMVRNEMIAENIAETGADLMRNLRRQAYIEYR